jgi:hypothetical protein
VTFVSLTNLNTPSTEAYGGYAPPASKKLMAVKKNEYFIGRLEKNDLSKLFNEVEAKSGI